MIATPPGSRLGGPVGRDVELRVVDADVAEAVGAPVDVGRRRPRRRSPPRRTSRHRRSRWRPAEASRRSGRRDGHRRSPCRRWLSGRRRRPRPRPSTRRWSGGGPRTWRRRRRAGRRGHEPRPTGSSTAPPSADTAGPLPPGANPAIPTRSMEPICSAEVASSVVSRSSSVATSSDWPSSVAYICRIDPSTCPKACGPPTSPDVSRLATPSSEYMSNVRIWPSVVPMKRRWRTGSIVSATAPGTAAAKTGSRVPRS